MILRYVRFKITQVSVVSHGEHGEGGGSKGGGGHSDGHVLVVLLLVVFLLVVFLLLNWSLFFNWDNVLFEIGLLNTSEPSPGSGVIVLTLIFVLGSDVGISGESRVEVAVADALWLCSNDGAAAEVIVDVTVNGDHTGVLASGSVNNTGFENQILKGPLTRGLKRVARPTEGLGFRGGENH